MATVSKFILSVLAFALFGCANKSEKNNSIQKRDSLNDKIVKSTDAFNKRSIYKFLTTEIIDSTSNEQLLQVVFDNLLEKFPPDYDKELQTVLTWNEPRQAIYIIQRLEDEVNNGGYNQFYYNSSGKYASLAPDALKLIGAKQYADLTVRANSLYKKEYSKITKYQDGTTEGFSKSYDDNPLEKFDDEFYKLEKQEDLRKIRIDFIRKNKSHFVDN